MHKILTLGALLGATLFTAAAARADQRCMSDPFSSPSDLMGQRFSCPDGTTYVYRQDDLMGDQITSDDGSVYTEGFPGGADFLGRRTFSGSDGDIQLETSPW